MRNREDKIKHSMKGTMSRFFNIWIVFSTILSTILIRNRRENTFAAATANNPIMTTIMKGSIRPKIVMMSVAVNVKEL